MANEIEKILFVIFPYFLRTRLSLNYGKEIFCSPACRSIGAGRASARKCGGYLIAAVAQDTVVKKLKGKMPREPLKERLARLRAAKLADKIVAGDSNINSWKIVKKYQPDIICLGYDQTALAASLKTWAKKEKLTFAIITLPAYHPSQYHSSLRP